MSLAFEGDGFTADYAGGDGNDVVASVPLTNLPPVVDAGGPYTVPFGGSIVLAGSATDPNGSGTIAKIEWDLDGDGVFGETGSTSAPNGDEVGRTPTFLAAGLSANSTHPVTLRVRDHGGLVTEDQATLFITLVPDLTISSSDIAFSPVNPAVGQLVTIQATVRNLGLAKADNVVVRFLDFGIAIGEVTIAQINAGASAQVSLPTGFNEASHRLIAVRVDPGNSVLELNEQNNEASLVLQVGQPTQSGAAIVVTAGPVTAYQGRTAWVSGQAFYDFTTVPGTNDHPVQGGRVTVAILDSAGQSRGVFTGATSSAAGGFAQLIVAPHEIGDYTLKIDVTDGTVTTQFNTTLNVTEYDEPPPPPPAPPPPLPPPPPGGDPATDVAISSQGIVFSDPNPGIGDPITILARLWYTGPTTRAVPVTVNDVFPVAGALQTFPIGTTTAQLPASPGEWIYVSISVTWTNTADGAHVIQIVAAPPFAQPTSNDEATRSIFVGTPPADLDIAKSVDLLVDADGNSVVSPGDTLRYTIRFDNTGGTDVSGAVIFDDYSEVLLEEPFGLSRPGTIAGGKITWNLGTIGAESYGELIYDVRDQAARGVSPGGALDFEHRDSRYRANRTDRRDGNGRRHHQFAAGGARRRPVLDLRRRRAHPRCIRFERPGQQRPDLQLGPERGR